MDYKNLFKRKGLNVFRVDKIHNLKIDVRHIDPEYQLKTEPEIALSSTGLLPIFEVCPKEKGSVHPSFTARWDQNKETLDVDMVGVEKSLMGEFKGERDGYSGHHPERLALPSRTYNVDIKTPHRQIFVGNVTFNINHGHEPGLFR